MLKNQTISLISIDIETLSTAPNAAIVSIGAELIGSMSCYQNTIQRLHDQECEKQFYGVLDTRYQQEPWFDTNQDTVNWWQKQSDEAKKAYLQSTGQGEEEALDPPDGCQEFLDYVEQLPGSPVWVVQGADFDIPILNNLLLQYTGKPLPGHYRHKVCLRTLSMVIPMTMTKATVGHDALSDAVSQASRLKSLPERVKRDLVKSLFRSAGYRSANWS